MPVERSDLSFEFHYGADLVGGQVLWILQEVLSRLAPKAFATLEAQAYERDSARLHIDCGRPEALRDAVVAKGTERGPTFHALVKSHGAPEEPRRFGQTWLRGRGAGSGGWYLSVRFDSRTPVMPSGSSWLWSNSITGWISKARVEGIPRQEWVLMLAEELAVRTAMLWGAAYVNPEFACTNLDTTVGLRAIGRDVRTSLPGVYWLNVFGLPYVDLIGEERLLAAPGVAADRKGDHIVVRTYPDAENWAAHETARRELIAALGAEFFFDRDNSSRQHRAPDFGLPQLQDRPPFQVITSDGVNFTPLLP